MQFVKALWPELSWSRGSVFIYSIDSEVFWPEKRTAAEDVETKEKIAYLRWDIRGTLFLFMSNIRAEMMHLRDF